MAADRAQSHYDAAIIQQRMEVIMGKRTLATTTTIEEPDFPEVARLDSLELPTDEEFMCTEDDVREEYAMLGSGFRGALPGGAFESAFD